MKKLFVLLLLIGCGDEYFICKDGNLYDCKGQTCLKRDYQCIVKENSEFCHGIKSVAQVLDGEQIKNNMRAGYGSSIDLSRHIYGRKIQIEELQYILRQTDCYQQNRK